MSGILRPRANIPRMAGGRCMSTPPACVPRKKIIRIPRRCAVHVRRRPAAKTRTRRVARVSCRCLTAAREPDQEADLPR